MADSPYKRPDKEPVEVTRELVKDHPLDFTVLRDAAITAWEMLWETRVGTGETAVPIHECLKHMVLPALVT